MCDTAKIKAFAMKEQLSLRQAFNVYGRLVCKMQDRQILHDRTGISFLAKIPRDLVPFGTIRQPDYRSLAARRESLQLPPRESREIVLGKPVIRNTWSEMDFRYACEKLRSFEKIHEVHKLDRDGPSVETRNRQVFWHASYWDI